MSPTPEQIEAASRVMWSYCTSSNHQDEDGYEGPSCPVCIDAATEVLEAAASVPPPAEAERGYFVGGNKTYGFTLDEALAIATARNEEYPDDAPHFALPIVAVPSSKEPTE